MYSDSRLPSVVYTHAGTLDCCFFLESFRFREMIDSFRSRRRHDGVISKAILRTHDASISISCPRTFAASNLCYYLDVKMTKSEPRLLRYRQFQRPRNDPDCPLVISTIDWLNAFVQLDRLINWFYFIIHTFCNNARQTFVSTNCKLSCYIK